MIDPIPTVAELFQKEEPRGRWIVNRMWFDWLANLRSLLVTKPFELATFTVAGLPSSPTPRSGSIAYASNGRKTGEGAGAGTGVAVYFSAAQWRRFYDDAQVTA